MEPEERKVEGLEVIIEKRHNRTSQVLMHVQYKLIGGELLMRIVNKTDRV